MKCFFVHLRTFCVIKRAPYSVCNPHALLAVWKRRYKSSLRWDWHYYRQLDVKIQFICGQYNIIQPDRISRIVNSSPRLASAASWRARDKARQALPFCVLSLFRYNISVSHSLSCHKRDYRECRDAIHHLNDMKTRLGTAACVYMSLLVGARLVRVLPHLTLTQTTQDSCRAQ